MKIAREPVRDNAIRAEFVSEFLAFQLSAREALNANTNASDSFSRAIRSTIEEHYLDDRGQPAVYQKLDSALSDDAHHLATLWNFFSRFDPDQLRRFEFLIGLETEGLSGDRHPRKIFDRSPFGIVALIVGTITVWMTVLKTFSGEDLSEFLEAVRFQWVAGSIWIGGLFVTLWYIVRTIRNNKQLAFLATLHRALAIYLDKRFATNPGERSNAA